MGLPYDGDTNDESQYCEHGTFIGSWWGPDYLCGWCEAGTSREEYEEIQVQNSISYLKSLPSRFWPSSVLEGISEGNPSLRTRILCYMVPMIMDDAEAIRAYENMNSTILRLGLDAEAIFA